MNCRACGGKGKVRVSVPTEGPVAKWATRVCRACNGSGRESPPLSSPATVHLHGQPARHDDARIVANREGLLALRHAIDGALASGAAMVPVFASDGDGYTLHVERDDLLFEKAPDHYFDLP